MIIFGSSIESNITDWIKTLFITMNNLFSSSDGIGQSVSTTVTSFSVVACSMLIVYFIIDLINQASRDMFSFDKLVVAFIKLVAAVAILLELPIILQFFFKFGLNLYAWIHSGTTANDKLHVKIFGQTSISDLKEQVKTNDKFLSDSLDHYTGSLIDTVLNGIGLMMMSLIVDAIGVIALIVGYFVATSAAIKFIVGAMLSPFAVVQCFEDGTRSSGIRYLKGLFADAITLAVIALILKVCAAFTSSMSVTFINQMADDVPNIAKYGLTGNDDNSTLSSFMSLSRVLKLLLPQLAAVGSMAGASKIAHDVMGG